MKKIGVITYIFSIVFIFIGAFSLGAYMQKSLVIGSIDNNKACMKYLGECWDNEHKCLANQTVVNYNVNMPSNISYSMDLGNNFMQFLNETKVEAEKQKQLEQKKMNFSNFLIPAESIGKYKTVDSLNNCTYDGCNWQCCDKGICTTTLVACYEE